MQTYDLSAPTTRSELNALYAKMRNEPGLCRVEPFGAYAASRYEDILVVQKDAQRFSAEAIAAAAEPSWLGHNPLAHSMLSRDPPRHTQLRALVSRAFGPAGLARLESVVRREAEALAESVVRQREVELVDTFCFLLPRNIIGHLLGLDPSTFPEFKRWVSSINLIASATPEQYEGIRSAVREMKHDMGAVIAERRRKPGEDMVSDLVRAEVEGSRLSDDELMSFLFLLITAGMESTTHLIGNSVIHLARLPEQFEQARADKAHIPRFIEEVLRYEPPIQLNFRMAASDVELSGTKVPAGSLVLALIAAGNLDERVFEQPEQFLPGREKGTQHLTFGQGMHFCLGAQLARMEARFALEALVSRIRELKLRSPEIEWIPNYGLHGPRVLPVELIPA
ncbi:cytochrome P450 [Archangium lipolyticum]|uniref:cytochrome P450 n=1 Tax=Archangium lipolyticum TaxID=2970465 RepID=UPI002149E84A|nr:cytochrome P450 [Archangium lipolyticum]